MLFRAAAILTLSVLFGQAHAATRVNVESGVLAGQSEGDIDSYKGIPYTAPPVGTLRWRPPQPAATWHGARSALQYGPICPQPKRPDGVGAAAANFVQSEDCLTLNVWAQHGPGHAPVMVWIHGGAHRFGSGTSPFYDGTAFARDGIVFVTINYRLGLLGYFAHPALTAAARADEPLGNYGTMDQIAALKWIQRNIAAFGGDPSNVTVFGESAGGASILYLLATPSAKGLYARAIVESGGGWARPTTLADEEAQGIAFAERAGLKNATAEELRALAVDKTFDIQAGLGFGPFVDGRLTPETPAQAFADGHAIDVPLIIGSNSFEASLMRSFSIPADNIVARMTSPERALYSDSAASDDALAHAVFTDTVMGAPAHWIAARASGGAPSYLYHFSYVPTLRRGMAQGAAHGSEIPFVFGNIKAVAARFGVALSAEDRAAGALMHTCWVNFAKTGAPNCGGWTPYTPDTDRLMEFDVSSGPKANFRKAQYDALESRTLPTLSLH